MTREARSRKYASLESRSEGQVREKGLHRPSARNKLASSGTRRRKAARSLTLEYRKHPRLQPTDIDNPTTPSPTPLVKVNLRVDSLLKTWRLRNRQREKYGPPWDSFERRNCFSGDIGSRDKEAWGLRIEALVPLCSMYLHMGSEHVRRRS